MAKKTLADDFRTRCDAGQVPLVVQGSDGRWHIGTWEPVEPECDPLFTGEREDRAPGEVEEYVTGLLIHYKVAVEYEISKGRKGRT